MEGCWVRWRWSGFRFLADSNRWHHSGPRQLSYITTWILCLLPQEEITKRRGFITCGWVSLCWGTNIMTQNEIILTIDGGWRGSLLSSLAPALSTWVTCVPSWMETVTNSVIYPFTQENHPQVTRDANRWEEHEMSARDTQKVTLIQLHTQITAYLDP